MNRRHIAIGAIATLALMAAGAAGVTTSTSEANHPAEADLIAQRCQGFTKASVWIAFRAGIMNSTRKYLLHAHHDGRIALDSVAGSRERIYWDGQQLTRSHAVNPAPRVIDGYDQVIADVWSECRAGFAGSTWSSASAPQDTPTRAGRWLALDLPFAWADDIEVRVGYSGGSGELMQVVLLDPTGTVIQNFGLVGEDWTATFPDQALGPDVPPFFPPKWEGWNPRDSVAQEVLDGADPKDLLIPIGPPE